MVSAKRGVEGCHHGQSCNGNVARKILAHLAVFGVAIDLIAADAYGTRAIGIYSSLFSRKKNACQTTMATPVLTAVVMCCLNIHATPHLFWLFLCDRKILTWPPEIALYVLSTQAVCQIFRLQSHGPKYLIYIDFFPAIWREIPGWSATGVNSADKVTLDRASAVLAERSAVKTAIEKTHMSGK